MRSTLFIEKRFKLNLNRFLIFCYFQLENYGIPKAWTAKDYFALVMETDIEHLVKFSSSFMTNELCLNNIMEIIRLESKLDLYLEIFLFTGFNLTLFLAVSVCGTPCTLLHSDRIPILIYSLNNTNIKGLFIKLSDTLYYLLFPP